MIQIGEKLPESTLYEFIEDEREGCTLGPNSFDVQKETAGKQVVIFGLPGAFTPTCSGKHVPGFVEHRILLNPLLSRRTCDHSCLRKRGGVVCRPCVLRFLQISTQPRLTLACPCRRL